MRIKQRIAFLFAGLFLSNAVVWGVAASVFAMLLPSNVPLLLIAWTLGLRHAFDADHIAAIDNVTRRLLASGKVQVTTGLMFSLGHSTIVLIASLLVACISASFAENLSDSNIPQIVGTCIAATFLVIIGVINLFTVFTILKNMKNVNSKGDQDIKWEDLLDQGGYLTRIFGKNLFRVIDTPFKMYLLGFLFGLGFDTAAEIALLGISAIQGKNGVNPGIILFLPLLFTCGMTLLDSVDCVVMLGIYNFSLVSPLKKLYFNLIICILSVFLSFSVAVLEILGLIQSEYELQGAFWNWISGANENFMFIGVASLGIFILSWLFASTIYYGRGYHRNNAIIQDIEVLE